MVRTVHLRVGAQLNAWDFPLYANNMADSRPILMSRMGDDGTESAAWMSGSLLTRPREIGFTGVYRY